MYWPNKQSVHLNLEVAQLFIQTYRKFFTSLENKTSQKLPIDILKLSIKKKLMFYTLIELEITILDIIELDLSAISIYSMSNQILYDLVSKVLTKFINISKTTTTPIRINLDNKYNKVFFQEHNYLFKTLLIYLIYGSKSITKNLFTFHENKIPKYHVKILLENSILRISNLLIFNLLASTTNLKNMTLAVKQQNIYSLQNQSIREMTNFQNNLFSYSWLYYYTYYPQDIYCNRYKVWLFSSKGIVYRYIYANRQIDYLALSQPLINSILYLEIQDFILPKINFLVSLLGKLIIYILIETISKSTYILLKQIIIRIDKKIGR